MDDGGESFDTREEILRYLEEDCSDPTLNHRRADLFRRAAYMAASEGDLESAKGHWAEFLLFSLHAAEPDNGSGEFLQPMITVGSWGWPDPNSLPDVMLDYLEDRWERTRTPYLKARYADFLWQRGRGHGYARHAALAHLELVRQEAEQGRYHSAADSARRAVSLAFALNDRRLTAQVVEHVTAHAEQWTEAAADAGYFAAAIIERILANRRFRDKSSLMRWQNLLSVALSREQEHHTRRELLSQLAKVLDRLGLSKEAREWRVKIGDEWEGEAQERESSSSLVAAVFRQHALKAYTEAGASEKVEELKKMIRQGYDRAAETEFGTVSHRFEIDFSDWDERVSGWLELAAADFLTHLAANFWLMPTWEEAEQIAGDLMDTAPLSQLIPMITLDDGRPISQPRTEQEQWLDNVRRQYQWQLVFKRIYLTRALGLLKERGQLDADSLVLSMRHSPVFDDEKMPMIARGFERYAAGDFVSALHILVPHLEDSLRRFLAKLGGSATYVTGGKMREKSLDQVLAADEMKAALATIAPLHRYLEQSLVDETGLNLRNRVAHGLLSEDECDAENANTVVHIFLVLGLLRAKDDKSD